MTVNDFTGYKGKRHVQSIWKYSIVISSCQCEGLIPAQEVTRQTEMRVQLVYVVINKKLRMVVNYFITNVYTEMVEKHKGVVSRIQGSV